MLTLKQNNLNNDGKFNEELIKKVSEISKKTISNLPWLNGLDYQSHVGKVKEVFGNFNRKYEKLIVLGIGGSALGTTAVLSALNKGSNVIVLDNIDPEYCDDVFANLDWENTLINVISKSGNTIETLAQLSGVKNILENKGLQLKNHIIVTTGNEKNPLRDFALKYDLLTLEVPSEVGGRFSVFTSVSLLPLHFAGVDIEKFTTSLISKGGIDSDISFRLALAQIRVYEEGKNISVFMTYNKRLFGLLDWYRQLLAESIGKSREIGITPILAIGSTDQHSQLQLYLQGPSDKFITLVNSNFIEGIRTGEDFDIIKNKSFGEIQAALLEGTRKSFENYGVGFQEICIEKIDEESISNFLISFMIQVQILGEYFGVNTFDQPAVEYGKIKAKEILKT